MFIITQFIGLYVVNHYSLPGEGLPYGMDVPEIEEEKQFFQVFPSIIIAFIIAIVLLFLLIKFKFAFIMKLWFFFVVVIALGISLNAIIPLKQVSIIALAIALPLAFIKIYRRNFIIHNLTELFIYPGVASVFVPILNLWTVGILLLLISIYDAWAVWHSGIMQKMAKYQINKLNIFAGFFVPSISAKMRQKLKKMKKSDRKKKGIKVNLAILGGGDVVFPIITAGVVLNVLGVMPALFVIAGATLGLSYLFFFGQKKKFYPAMPFITAGILLGLLVSWIITLA